MRIVRYLGALAHVGLCLLLSKAAWARELTFENRVNAQEVLHVRVDGSDAACSGLVDAPDPGSGTMPRDCAFQTPQKGVDAAGPGDTVLLHAGTYTDSGTSIFGIKVIIGINLRGEFDSEPHRLTIASAGDGEVVFDGAGELDTGVVVWGTSYVTLQGISFRRFTAVKNLFQPIGLAFWGNFSAAAVNVGAPGPQSPSNHLILRSLDIDDSVFDGAYIFAAEIAMWCASCTDNAIESSRITSFEWIGIAVGGGGGDQRGVIANNTIARSRGRYGIFSERTGGWTVQGNYFDDAAVPKRTVVYDVELIGGFGWTIAGNIFHHPVTQAITIGRFMDSDPPGANLVLNNTIDCSGDGIAVRSSCTACQIRNNIVRNCATAVYLQGDNTGTQLGFNDLFGNGVDYDSTTESGTGFTLVGSDVQADPLFRKDMPQPDPYYRLRLSSPAIGAGDAAHCGVVGDAACDIGALQVAFPRVAAADPAPGTSGVAVSVHPRLTFNVPVDASSLTSSTIKLLRTSRPRLSISVSLAVEDSGRTVRITPLEWIDSDARHRIIVVGGPGGVRSRDGGDPGKGFAFGFATESALASSIPAAGDSGVPISVVPRLTFKWPLVVDSVTSTVFRLKDVTTGKSVPVAAALGADGLTVTLTPDSALKSHHTFRITVAGGAEGLHYRISAPASGEGSAGSLASLETSSGSLGAPINVTFRTGR